MIINRRSRAVQPALTNPSERPSISQILPHAASFDGQMALLLKVAVGLLLALLTSAHVDPASSGRPPTGAPFKRRRLEHCANVRAAPSASHPPPPPSRCQHAPPSLTRAADCLRQECSFEQDVAYCRYPGADAVVGGSLGTRRRLTHDEGNSWDPELNECCEISTTHRMCTNQTDPVQPICVKIGIPCCCYEGACNGAEDCGGLGCDEGTKFCPYAGKRPGECIDAQDECLPTCEPGQKACSNGNCIPDDGTVNCELDCTRDDEDFCYYTRKCISESAKCLPECGLNEKFCEYSQYASECIKEEDECRAPECEGKEHPYFCDYTEKCVSESAECLPECEPDQKACPNGNCIPDDGSVNCELDCTRDDEDFCYYTRKCISESSKCLPECGLNEKFCEYSQYEGECIKEEDECRAPECEGKEHPYFCDYTEKCVSESAECLPECKPDQKACPDGNCIPDDGSVNCGLDCTRDDEYFCDYTEKCISESAECEPECGLNEKWCWWLYECIDESAECVPNSCGPDEVGCPNGNCIPDDGSVNCELDCARDDEYFCDYARKCISESAKCLPECEPGQKACPNGWCMPDDGTVECPAYCPDRDQHQCPDGTCVDSYEDCNRCAEDEKQCKQVPLLCRSCRRSRCCWPPRPRVTGRVRRHVRVVLRR